MHIAVAVAPFQIIRGWDPTISTYPYQLIFEAVGYTAFNIFLLSNQSPKLSLTGYALFASLLLPAFMACSFSLLGYALEP
jgi:hypothetical protein